MSALPQAAFEACANMELGDKRGGARLWGLP